MKKTNTKLHDYLSGTITVADKGGRGGGGGGDGGNGGSGNRAFI